MNPIKRTCIATLLALAFGWAVAGPASAFAQDKNQAEDAAPAARSGLTKATNADSSATMAEAEDTNATPAAAAPEESKPDKTSDDSGIRYRPVVVFGHNAELKAGETAEAVVVIGGSAKIRGHVNQAVVVIGGNADIDSEVGDAAVAIMGNIHAGKGAKIHGDTVAVLGRIEALAGALIEGDVVCVGGKSEIAEGAKVKGDVQNVEIPAFVGLQNWFYQCVLKLRPLSPKVGWVWIVAGMFFACYLFIAAVFRSPVKACVEVTFRRPATTFLLGLLAIILKPLILLILTATGIGILVVVFLVPAIFVGVMFGKVALLEWTGQTLARQFGAESGIKPLFAFLVGAILLTLAYLVPVLGAVVFAVTGVWALGIVVTAVIGSAKREMPEKPAGPNPAAPPPGAGFEAGAGALGAVPVAGGTFASSEFGTGMAGGVGVATAPVSVAPQPALPDMLVYPRAGFWIRMAAAFLDLILVGIIAGFTRVAPLGMLAALAYYTGMWTWRGTTVGGAILGLRVVRIDNQPLSFTVALVRALAAAFSSMVFFLGIIWIGWDREKQGWHDKLAGTVVVKLPHTTPLV
jgi:uncharacterized RDD family membrane protein YckC